MRTTQFIVLTPVGKPDAGMAIAACRAGALGMLDLQHAAPAAAQAAVAHLRRYTSGDFGIKIGNLPRDQISNLPDAPAVVLLCGGEGPGLEATVQQVRSLGARLFFEAVSLHEALLGEQLGADAIVLKGHESGGRVGPETSFILLQRCAARLNLPLWVQGGVGLHTAAACEVAGTAGVVLDGQVLLARESPLDDAARQRLTAFDGSQTVCLGERLGQAYRFYCAPNLFAVEELRRTEDALTAAELTAEEKLRRWDEAVALRVADPTSGLWPLGQDAATAASLAEHFSTVSGIVQAIAESATQHVEAARRAKPLAAGSLLAGRHGTRYPIAQGPMTRVSDTAQFADAVARNGGLPFLALALMRREEVERLLQHTAELLGDRPWGVGMLGFAPAELRREQLELIRAYRPPFALIAGGRPDQARELEGEGITTYLHVPSPELLRLFLNEGARRFVFEGRECGGHCGPRTSFALWEAVCEILQQHLDKAGGGDDLSVLFAGGIHDDLSAAMVAAAAGRLAERGAGVGALLGTAYIYTREAVESGAIVETFQQEALRGKTTVLLESGPGHEIRCLDTPFAAAFASERERQRAEGRSADEIRLALEKLNIGRLRIAAKGIDRHAVTDSSSGNGEARQYVHLSEEQQRDQGLYMIGQVAPLREQVTTMADLHASICDGSTRRLEEQPAPIADALPRSPAADIAIIGIDCFFPQAGSLQAYWRNILERRDAITEVPRDHWDWRLYFDPEGKGAGKINSKWGGFLDDVHFDPLRYGMPPNSLTSIEPLQLLLLEAVRRALDDAGYGKRPLNRERTAVVLGAGGGAAQLSMAYAFQAYLPLIDAVPGVAGAGQQIQEKCGALLPKWTEDTFPGILLNVAAGRVANRFDFGGACFSVDAACGSSLAAIYLGTRELQSGASDVAVVMGGDTVQNPFTYMLFSNTNTFSPRGRCRPFDETADGIVISEGIGVVVLKRLADAERDGDRIYAVIKGVGASSDGRDKGLTAPRPEGQLRALRRAYTAAGVSPARVGMIEAHGTGTVAGDRSEVESAGRILAEAGAKPRACALSSVKSMIGHTKCAAGLAGLINATLALRHKVRPPILTDRPNPKADFAHSPFYLNTKARPWIHGGQEPRCAGVSAFGFGGTNFHAVLEEYAGDFARRESCGLPAWPAELLVWRRATRAALLDDVAQCRAALDREAPPALADLAASLSETAAEGAAQPVLAVIASSHDDLRQKLDDVLAMLRTAELSRHDPRGIYFAERPDRQGAKIAVLFPGQGAQRPDMLAQLAMAFDEVRNSFDRAEQTLDGCFDRPLGSFIFPPSPFTPEEEKANAAALTRSHVAQPAVGAASLGMFRLLENLGLEADMFAGHSYGGFTALCAAGALDEEELIRLSHRRGLAVMAAGEKQPGGMLAVNAGRETVADAIAGIDETCIANLNAPQQTVVSGTEAGLEQAAAVFAARGIRTRRLDVACAFHSPWMADAREPLAAALADCGLHAPAKPVYSNVTAAPFPNEPTGIVALLVEHLTSPVRFQEEVEAMYAAGARIFVEVGPQGVVTGLVSRILGNRPHVAVAVNAGIREDLVQLQHAMAHLLTCGVDLRLDRLFSGRDLQRFPWSQLAQQSAAPHYAPSTWLVNSTRARPIDGPEPATLGQPSPLGVGLDTDSGAAVGATGVPPVIAKQHGQDTRATLAFPPTATPTEYALPKLSVPDLSAVSGAVGAPLGATGVSPASTVSVDEATRVVLGFQNLMSQFLQTQRSVMESYFRGSSAPLGQPLHGHIESADARRGSTTAAPMEAAARAMSAAPTAASVPAAPPVNAPVAAKASPPQNGQPATSKTTGDKSVCIDRGALTAQLLDLVSKRTGYPPEMLNLDLNMEADLGIDSIKRVEILSGLISAGNGNWSNGQVEMEKLTSFKRLREIIDYLLSAAEKNGKAPAEAQSVAKPPSAAPALAAPKNGKPPARRVSDEGIQRMLVEPVPIADPPRQPFRPLPGTLLVTDDGRGVAVELMRELRGLGQRAVLLCMPTANGKHLNGDRFTADLSDPAAVEDLFTRIRVQHGEIAGLIHLLPLAESTHNGNWAGRMRHEVKSLFLLARGLAKQAGATGSASDRLLLAATAMGGSFGVGPAMLPDTFFPGQGGVAGLVKSLAHEWPEALVRVVDFHAREPAGAIADRLLAELGDAHGPVEVGYLTDERITLDCKTAPLPASNGQPIPLDSHSTVLITGGARGITAAVALELARRYQPRLVLVGRSPLPPASESPETAALSEAAALKAAIVSQLRAAGRPAAPADVEKVYRRLLRDREIRSNLARLRDTGAEVHYFEADVRDEPSLAAVIAQIEGRFGGCDGVIHGAGVIDDKLIGDKTAESYEYVFGTKLDSAMNLSRLLRPEKLKFCAFFASVAGRFGNRGQSDYAAANEVLSKLARYLDQRWPGRVVSIAWGPWSQIGMVSELEQHLSQRGLQLIPPEVGPLRFEEELRCGHKGECEVVIAGEVGQLRRAHRAAAEPAVQAAE